MCLAPLGLTMEGSTKFKLKGWKCYLKKLQCGPSVIFLSYRDCASRPRLRKRAFHRGSLDHRRHSLVDIKMRLTWPSSRRGVDVIPFFVIRIRRRISLKESPPPRGPAPRCAVTVYHSRITDLFLWGIIILMTSCGISKKILFSGGLILRSLLSHTNKNLIQNHLSQIFVFSVSQPISVSKRFGAILNPDLNLIPPENSTSSKRWILK